MKINQPCPNKLDIQVAADLPYLGSLFVIPKRSKLVLPERTIDQETTLERVDQIRKFLAISPISNIDT